MAKKTEPSKYAAALQYLQQMRDRAADFGGGVVDTLGNRARDVGGLAYEALTSDPSIGRMTTAEFSQAAADRSSTPRLDATAQGIGAMGKALVTQPVQTAKAIVVDPIVNAFESPRAMGQFAGDFVNPLRIAAALRKTAPIAELDVYHGTPHRFPGTEENPLGEFDASKIGTGEGVQSYGHGVYLAQSPDVAEGYRPRDYKTEDKLMKLYRQADSRQDYDATQVLEDAMLRKTANELQEMYPQHEKLLNKIGKITAQYKSSLYKADLPDEMIDRMLDWDAPVDEVFASKFMKAVRRNETLEEADFMDALGLSEDYLGEPEDGRAIYKLLSDSFDSDAKASEFLRKTGIPGIRFKDANSRGGDSATGTRNFVVFPGEEKKVRILERK